MAQTRIGIVGVARFVIACCVVALVVTSAALAEPARPPARGARLPTVRIQQLDAGALMVPAPSLPVLVIYEDQKAQAESERARALLARLGAYADNRERLRLVAVADVEQWNWWPARHYAEKDLRKIAAREGTAIYVDWRGELRRAWALPRGHSALVLVDGDGRVRFASVGRLDDAGLATLRAELAALGLRLD